MAGFNPDQFLAETAPKASGFDPDKFLAETTPQEKPMNPNMVAARSFINKASGGFSDEVMGGFEAAGKAIGVKGLGGPLKDVSADPEGPTLDLDKIKAAYKLGRDHERMALQKGAKQYPFDSDIAGLVGSIVSPINRVLPGASLATQGAAIGGLQALGNSDKEDLKGLAIDTGLGSALGGTTGKLVDISGDVAKYLGDKGSAFLDKFKKVPAEHADEVIAAAKRLSIPTTESMLTSNELMQKAESGLAQSGSFPAQETRNNYQKVAEGLKSAGDKIENLSNTQSANSLGRQAGESLNTDVNAMKAPITELYTPINKELKSIPIHEPAVNAAFGALKRDPLFTSTQGKQVLDDVKGEILGNYDNLADLKEFRSSLNKRVSSQAAPIDQQRMDKIYDAVTKIRDNSLEAMKSNPILAAGGKSAADGIDQLTGDLALADSAHKGVLSDLNSVKRSVGITKDVGSTSQFLSKVNEMPEEQLINKLANSDVSTLNSVKEKFPQAFDKAKQFKINELVDKSKRAGVFDQKAFLKNVDGLEPEVKNLLFDKDMIQHMNDLNTINKAIPGKLGPSGTPEGIMTMDMFSPTRNLKDFAISQALKSASADGPQVFKSATQNLQNYGKSVAEGGVRSATQRVAGFFGSAMGSKVDQIETPKKYQPTQPRLGNDAPTKGPEKWANDGIQKLKDHGADLDQKTIEKLKSTQKGRDLLNKASDLKPGTAAMDKILLQIKSSYLNGAE